LLTADQRARASKIRIDVKEKSWDLYGISAPVLNGVEVIEIPLGLVFMLDAIDSAVVATEMTGIDRPVLVGYISRLTEQIAKNQERRDAGKVPEPLVEFPAFAGISSKQWALIVNDPRFANFKDVMKLSSFGFLVFHEIAHHIIPEAASTNPTHISEVAADKFAIEYTIKADLNPMFAFYTFSLFGKVEEMNEQPATGQNHPASLCRALKFFMNGRAAAENDADFVRHLKRQNLWSQWKHAPEQVQAVLDEEGVSCEDWDVVEDAP